ncbi:MAG: DMT family transporter [Planctomycetes bacterium]|nr:DMT family transporter [Planctomycetota bacterium]
MYIAIIAGLLAGFAQAISYLVTRAVLHEGKTTPLCLLALSHIWMGIVSLCALPFVWQEPAQGLSAFCTNSSIVVASYFSAQACFFYSVQFTPSSRLAPMMGIKVIFAAIFAWLILGKDQHLMQWLAVLLCLVAACAVQWSGQSIIKKSLIAVVAAVVFFSISDLHITFVADIINPDTVHRGIMVPVIVVLTVYAGCLIPSTITLGVLRYQAKEHDQQQETALPIKGSIIYATVWLLGMFCLFTAFAYDLVFGTIMQSMRGPIAVFLGILVAKLGMHHLEDQRSKMDFLKQILSALLMVAAIALYCWYK